MSPHRPCYSVSFLHVEFAWSRTSLNVIPSLNGQWPARGAFFAQWSSRQKANWPKLLPGVSDTGRPREDKAWSNMASTTPDRLELNYTNTDLHDTKEIFISCEHRLTANHSLGFMLASSQSQQVANWHLVAIPSVQLTITSSVPPLAGVAGDPRGGWTPGEGRECTFDSLSP